MNYMPIWDYGISNTFILVSNHFALKTFLKLYDGGNEGEMKKVSPWKK